MLPGVIANSPARSIAGTTRSAVSTGDGTPTAAATAAAAATRATVAAATHVGTRPITGASRRRRTATGLSVPSRRTPTHPSRITATLASALPAVRHLWSPG